MGVLAVAKCGPFRKEGINLVLRLLRIATPDTEYKTEGWHHTQ